MNPSQLVGACWELFQSLHYRGNDLTHLVIYPDGSGRIESEDFTEQEIEEHKFDSLSHLYGILVIQKHGEGLIFGDGI